jgi:hypothetical protein
MLAGSFCPHYHSEAERRPLYHRLVAERALPGGVACDDGVGEHFVDDDLAELVTTARAGPATWSSPRVTVARPRPSCRSATSGSSTPEIQRRLISNGPWLGPPRQPLALRRKAKSRVRSRIGGVDLLFFGGGGAVQRSEQRGNEDGQQPPGVDLGLNPSVAAYGLGNAWMAWIASPTSCCDAEPGPLKADAVTFHPYPESAAVDAFVSRAARPGAACGSSPAFQAGRTTRPDCPRRPWLPGR